MAWGLPVSSVPQIKLADRLISAFLSSELLLAYLATAVPEAPDTYLRSRLEPAKMTRLRRSRSCRPLAAMSGIPRGF